MPPSWKETGDGAVTHHMLCKKVAQLTKVIYHLNTRNEDFSAGELVLEQPAGFAPFPPEDELRTSESQAAGPSGCSKLAKNATRSESKNASKMPHSLVHGSSARQT